MKLSPAELLEEVHARGADIAIAGHEGIRVEFRQRLPESLQNQIKERVTELRSYLDGLRHAEKFKQEEERYEAAYKSGNMRYILRASLTPIDNLDKLRRGIASDKRKLAKALRAGDSEQALILSSQITDLENYVERHSRRIKCSEEVSDVARDKVPDMWKTGASGSY